MRSSLSGGSGTLRRLPLLLLGLPVVVVNWAERARWERAHPLEALEGELFALLDSLSPTGE